MDKNFLFEMLKTSSVSGNEQEIEEKRHILYLCYSEKDDRFIVSRC